MARKLDTTLVPATARRVQKEEHATVLAAVEVFLGRRDHRSPS